MGNHDDGVVEAVQEILQPGDRLQVEVVGRLIQQQYVGVAEKRLGQEHAHLVATLKLLHQLAAHLLGNAEAVQKDRRLRLDFVAVHLGKIRLKFGGTDAVLFAELRLGVDRVPLGHHLVELLVPHDDRVEDGLLVVGELILLQDRDPSLAC